jgi:hypothetical protein
MSKKKSKDSLVDRWLAFNERLEQEIPHLSACWSDFDEFREIRIMVKPDATVLGMVKGYGSDGGLTICFGTGYGVVATLMALDSSIQGGNWKVDKPWDARNGKG